MSTASVPAETRSESPRRSRLADERLAQRVRSGDERSFGSLFERYHQRLYRYCRAMVSDDHEAEAALRATFERAFAALRRGQRNAPLTPWLFRIAHTEATAAAGPHEASGPDGPAVIPGLEALPLRQRGALLLRELAGLGYEDIGQALESSAAGARRTVFDARRALPGHAPERTLACEDVCRKLSEQDDHHRPARRLSDHLRHCPGCSAFAAAIPARRQALRARVPELSASLAEAVFADVLERLPRYARPASVAGGYRAALAHRGAGAASGRGAISGPGAVSGRGAGSGREAVSGRGAGSGREAVSGRGAASGVRAAGSSGQSVDVRAALARPAAGAAALLAGMAGAAAGLAGAVGALGSTTRSGAGRLGHRVAANRARPAGRGPNAQRASFSTRLREVPAFGLLAALVAVLAAGAAAAVLVGHGGGTTGAVPAHARAVPVERPISDIHHTLPPARPQPPAATSTTASTEDTTAADTYTYSTPTYSTATAQPSAPPPPRHHAAPPKKTPSAPTHTTTNPVPTTSHHVVPPMPTVPGRTAPGGGTTHTGTHGRAH